MKALESLNNVLSVNVVGDEGHNDGDAVSVIASDPFIWRCCNVMDILPSWSNL